MHVHLMGGRAAAAQEYPQELCRAVCKGLAAQKRYDLSTRFSTTPMSSLASVEFSRVCCQAAADERESCDDNVSSLCTKIAGDQSVWLAPIIKPVGVYPGHWNDGVHDCDGHGIKDRADDDKGDVLLNGELSALYVREGLAQAIDDVSQELFSTQD